MSPNYSTSYQTNKALRNSILFCQLRMVIFSSRELLPNLYNLFFSKLRTTLFFSSGPISSIPSYFIVAITFASTYIKMLGINATRSITMMTNKFIVRHFNTKKYKRGSMSPKAFAVKSKITIPISIGVTLPYPTPININCDKSHKPIHISHGRFVA